MRKITMLWLFAISTTIFAQQKFYPFATDERYGVVNDSGGEVVVPKYTYPEYYMPEDAGIFVLRDNSKISLVVNKLTGKQEFFENLSGTLFLHEDEMMYGIKNGKPMLINLKNPESRQLLAKKYTHLQIQYKLGAIVAYLPNKTFDILDSDTRKIIRANIKGESLTAYTTDRGLVLAVRNGKIYNFLDKDYKPMPKLKPAATDDLKKYLKTAGYTVEDDMQTGVAEYTPPKYPRISAKYESRIFPADVLLVFLEKKDSEIPILLMKNQPTGINLDSDEMKVSQTNSNHHVEFLFHVNPQTKAVLFPKKYWARHSFEEPK